MKLILIWTHNLTCSSSLPDSSIDGVFVIIRYSRGHGFQFRSCRLYFVYLQWWTMSWYLSPQFKYTWSIVYSLQNIFTPYLLDAWNECGATRFRTWQIQIKRNIPARRKERSWFEHYICFQCLHETPSCMSHCCRVLPSSWTFRCGLLGEPVYRHYKATTKKSVGRDKLVVRWIQA